eukprot:tig00000663_g2964.t1
MATRSVQTWFPPASMGKASPKRGRPAHLAPLPARSASQRSLTALEEVLVEKIVNAPKVASVDDLLSSKQWRLPAYAPVLPSVLAPLMGSASLQVALSAYKIHEKHTRSLPSLHELPPQPQLGAVLRGPRKPVTQLQRQIRRAPTRSPRSPRTSGSEGEGRAPAGAAEEKRKDGPEAPDSTRTEDLTPRRRFAKKWNPRVEKVVVTMLAENILRGNSDEVIRIYDEMIPPELPREEVERIKADALRLSKERAFEMRYS